MAETSKTSIRRFERIVKKIVREDIESQPQEDPRFFIDKDVFDHHLSEMMEKIEDSSLSDFLLKYDLSIHTTELVNYFGKQSKKRDFVNLRYLSAKYGCHLCYMALRESASDLNENETLVREMKSTAISWQKLPPSDLFVDSPLSTPASTTSNSPTNSGDENVPRGQGESEGSADKSNQYEDKLAQLKVKDLVVQKPAPFSEVSHPPTNGVLLVTHQREPSEEMNSQLVQPEEVDMSEDVKNQENMKPPHLQSCNCKICRCFSDPGPSSLEEEEKLERQRRLIRSQSEAASHIPKMEEEQDLHLEGTSVTENKGKDDNDRPRFPLVSQYALPQPVSSAVNHTSCRISGDNVDSELSSGAGYGVPFARSKEPDSTGERSEVIVSGLRQKGKTFSQIQEETRSDDVLAPSEQTVDSGIVHQY